MVARVLLSAGGTCAVRCPPSGFFGWCCQLSSVLRVTFTHIVKGRLLPRNKFISLILHLKASAYLLHGKPFSTWEMKLKTISWEVYLRNKRHLLSFTGRKQGQVWCAHSSLSRRGDAMQGSVSTGVSEDLTSHQRLHFCTLLDGRNKILSPEQVWLIAQGCCCARTWS